MGNGERQGSGHCKPCFSIPHTGIPDDWSGLIGYVNTFQSLTKNIFTLILFILTPEMFFSEIGWGSRCTEVLSNY